MALSATACAKRSMRCRCRPCHPKSGPRAEIGTGHRPANQTMQKLSIHGGARLSGEVRVAGAKNAALPILAASLLTASPVHITNVPQLNDVRTMVRLLERMGVKASATEHDVVLDASAITEPFAPYDLVKTMRASIL